MICIRSAVVHPRSSMLSLSLSRALLFFFFNDTATTEIYTLSLHDALPISMSAMAPKAEAKSGYWHSRHEDRKSTPLNSSNYLSQYAVFCLTKQQPTSR